MIFSEIYGTYYNTVTEILSKAAKEKIITSEIRRIVEEKAFGESILTIPDQLSAKGRWPLLDSEGNSILNNEPATPISLLQKRWLKSLLSDRRIRLFSPDDKGLEEIEPLFTPEMIVQYDRYSEGDPYEDENYIKCFKDVIKAIEEKRSIHISFLSENGNEITMDCIPVFMEYSGKNDRFRLFGKSNGQTVVLNLSKIKKIEMAELVFGEETEIKMEKKSVVLLLKDERQALERAMLHFMDCEKVTEQIEDDRYRITLWYDKSEEAEMLIRVLMFGPKIKVLEPAGFVEKIVCRLKQQGRVEK